MRTLRRIVALFGIAMGAVALWWAAGFWWFISRGPSPSVIHTEDVDIPFVWLGEMTWKEYAIVATPAILGIALIVVSYRFGFRRHAEPGASPNGGPTQPPTNSGAEERPPSVS
jgi:hypothetical protein